MKILHVTSTYAPKIGGVETVVADLVRYGRSRGIEADVLHLEPGLAPADETATDGARIFRRPLWPHRLVGLATGLRDIVAPYDLLHVHDALLAAVSLNSFLAAPGKPRVLSTHGGFFHTRNKQALKDFHWRYLAKGMLSQFDAVLASSHADRDLFATKGVPVKLAVNGVDVARFAAIPAGARPADRWLYWGRLSSNKRLDLAIDLVARLKARGQFVTLTIAGSDPDGVVPALTAQIAEAGIGDRVTLRPPLTPGEIADEIGRHGVYITASEYEGFGLTVIEAMAAGMVILCRDFAPLNQFVVPGVNGDLLAYDGGEADVDKAAAMARLGPEALGRLSANARGSALKHDWTQAIGAFTDAYAEAIAAPRRKS